MVHNPPFCCTSHLSSYLVLALKAFQGAESFFQGSECSVTPGAAEIGEPADPCDDLLQVLKYVEKETEAFSPVAPLPRVLVLVKGTRLVGIGPRALVSDLPLLSLMVFCLFFDCAGDQSQCLTHARKHCTTELHPEPPSLLSLGHLRVSRSLGT